MSYTFSKSWVSPETKEFERWIRFRDSISHIFPQSPVIPKTFAVWLSHRVAIKEDQLQRVASKIQEIMNKENSFEMPLLPIFGGRRFEHQSALDLAHRTIWSPFLETPHDRQLVPWSSYKEYEHQRNEKTKVGPKEFLPLTRNPSNGSIKCKRRKLLSQLIFDENRRRAAAEDDEEEEGQALVLDESFAAELIGVSLLLLLDP